MEEEIGKTSAVELFKKKTEVAMAKISSVEKFRKTDTMVDLVLTIGKYLLDKPLDIQSPDVLLKNGGRLTGAYAYLGQKASFARAERDVYEQKLSEVEKELTLNYLDGDYKVTEVRARVSGDVEELKELVLQKEAEKNQWESITESCSTMIMFIQSALKMKQSEGLINRNMHDNF